VPPNPGLPLDVLDLAGEIRAGRPRRPEAPDGQDLAPTHVLEQSRTYGVASKGLGIGI
jgi:hypothetical protein